MANRMQETLTITYEHQGQEPVSITIPRKSRRQQATRDDGRAIADSLISLKPGLNFSKDGVSVKHTFSTIERDSDGHKHIVPKTETLSLWDDQTRTAYNERTKQLEHGELKDLRKRARAEGKALTETNRKRRHEEPGGIVFGRQRARFMAWNPLNSPNVGIKTLSALVSTEVNSPYLIPGLGVDAYDIIHDLRPGRKTQDYVTYFSNLLGRYQDREFDFAVDIVHGIGKSILNIINKYQSGFFRGIAFDEIQALIPELAAAIDKIVLTEEWTSRDKRSAQIAMSLYTAMDSRVLREKLSTAHGSKLATPHNESEQKTAGAKVKDYIAERLHERLSPRSWIHSIRINSQKSLHRFLWGPRPSVLGMAQDRRTERQDESSMAYLKHLFSNEGLKSESLAYMTYRKQLAEAFQIAITQPRTAAEVSTRTLSGDVDAAEEKILSELEHYLPSAVMSIIKIGLHALHTEEKSQPGEYKAMIRGLKDHEIHDSYLNYITYLKPIAEDYRNKTKEITGHRRKDRKKQLIKHEEWKQTVEYLDYVLDIARAAQQIHSPSSQN